MKKSLCLLIFAILCISCFVACNEPKPQESGEINNPVQLSAPTISKKGETVTWESVENAIKYEISINKEIVATVDASVTSYPLYDNQILKVRAVGDGINYSTSEWSNAVFISIELPEDPL